MLFLISFMTMNFDKVSRIVKVDGRCDGVTVNKIFYGHKRDDFPVWL